MSRDTFTRFAGQELGLTLTNGQRVLALVAFDGLEPSQLDDSDREIARRLFGDVDTIPPIARRVLCLLLGRISGKTLLSAAFAIYVMCTDDVAACGPGDVPTALTIAPTKKLAGLAVRAGLELARRSPRLRKRIVKETSDGFQIRRPGDNRVVAFEAAAASRGGAAGRGVTILVAILDEAQFFLSDDGGKYAINDRDVYGGVAPRARRTIFISTPWPVPTLMGELLAANWQDPRTALAAKAPTLLMRDDDEEIALRVEAERQRDAVEAAREFDVDDQAMSGAGLFFDPHAITEAIVEGRPVTIPAPRGARVRAGVDLSAVRDPSALAVAGEVDRRGSTSLVHVLELLELHPRPGEPLRMSETIATFSTVLARYGVREFMADGWGREAAKEFASVHGVRIRSAPEGRDGKVQTYSALQTLFAEGRIAIPPHARLVSQLRSVTSRPAPGGSLIITSPRRSGSHGDLVSALVLACFGGPRLGRMATAVLSLIASPQTSNAETFQRFGTGYSPSTPADAAVHSISEARKKGWVK